MVDILVDSVVVDMVDSVGEIPESVLHTYCGIAVTGAKFHNYILAVLTMSSCNII